jgi:hypothetical protein
MQRLSKQGLPPPGGSAREFSLFCSEKPVFRNLCKFLAIKAQDGLGHQLKNVLTAKKGLFWGVLEEKWGGRDF